MKMRIRQISIVLLVAMLLTVFVSCRGNTIDSSVGESSVSTSDTKESSDSDTTTAGEDGSTTSTESDQGGDSQKTTTTASKKATTTRQQKATSLSWKQVLAQMPASLKGKTVEVFSWNDAADVKQAPAVIQKFEKETGIKVKWTKVPYGTYSTMLGSRVAANDAPDIVRLREETPYYLRYLQPVEKSGYNFNDTYWDQELLKAFTVKGKVYGVNMVNSPYYQPMVTIYNNNLIKKYGLGDPYQLWEKGEWTWDKMFEIAEDFLDQAGDGYYGVSTLFGEYLFSLGLSIISFDGTKYKANLSDPRWLTGWQYMAKANQDGLMADLIMDTDGFSSGKVLFYIDASIGLRNGHFFFRQLKEKGYVSAVPIPAVKGQKDYYQVLCENEAYGIAQRAKNAQTAPYFLRYYLDESNYDMKTFYHDSKVLEILQWTRKQKKISNLFSILQEDTSGFSGGDYVAQCIATPPDQMKSKLDSLAPAFQNAVDIANKIIGTLE